MNIRIPGIAECTEKWVTFTIAPLQNSNSNWDTLHVVAVNEILLLICSTFQSSRENKHATGKNKINIIAREIRVIISVLIEYQMEKQNNSLPVSTRNVF